MNSGLSLLGLSAAAPAISIVRQTAQSVVEPFQNIFAAAVERSASADPSSASDQEDGMRAKLARRLQELMRSLGAVDGDRVSLHVDADGAISASGVAAIAEGVETALRYDSELAGQVRALVEANAAMADSDWLGDAELRITATTGDAATIEWR
jgi:hypothetical protein